MATENRRELEIQAEEHEQELALKEKEIKELNKEVGIMDRVQEKLMKQVT